MSPPAAAALRVSLRLRLLRLRMHWQLEGAYYYVSECCRGPLRESLYRDHGVTIMASPFRGTGHRVSARQSRPEAQLEVYPGYRSTQYW
eukprot:415182-Rhodomonas_salina.1